MQLSGRRWLTLRRSSTLKLRSRVDRYGYTVTWPTSVASQAMGHDPEAVERTIETYAEAVESHGVACLRDILVRVASNLPGRPGIKFVAISQASLPPHPYGSTHRLSDGVRMFCSISQGAEVLASLVLPDIRGFVTSRDGGEGWVGITLKAVDVQAYNKGAEEDILFQSTKALEQLIDVVGPMFGQVDSEDLNDAFADQVAHTLSKPAISFGDISYGHAEVRIGRGSISAVLGRSSFVRSHDSSAESRSAERPAAEFDEDNSLVVARSQAEAYEGREGRKQGDLAQVDAVGPSEARAGGPAQSNLPFEPRLEDPGIVVAHSDPTQV